MSNPVDSAITRRKFLGVSSTVVGAAALTPLLSACQVVRAPQAVPDQAVIPEKSARKYQAKAPKTQPFVARAFGPSDHTTIRWLGAAGVLINSRGTALMIDPLLEGDVGTSHMRKDNNPSRAQVCARRLAGAFVAVVAMGMPIEGQGATTGSAIRCAQVFATPSPRGFGVSLSTSLSTTVYAAGERCVPEWADSLRSTNEANASVARNALMMMGGRKAVDALRDEAGRRPDRATLLAVLRAMATTGSPEDVAFLMNHLGTPVPDVPASQWAEFQAAATSLGLLRAEAARDSLRAASARSRPHTFDQQAVQAALAALDRPPCAGPIGADEKELIHIVLRCRPTSMWLTSRYQDQASGDVWVFADSSWRLTTRASGDTAGMSGVTFTTLVAADGLHAAVTLSTSCGPLCGEGWTYRLQRDGAVWRIVGSFMNWVR